MTEPWASGREIEERILEMTARLDQAGAGMVRELVMNARTLRDVEAAFAPFIVAGTADPTRIPAIGGVPIVIDHRWPEGAITMREASNAERN